MTCWFILRSFSLRKACETALIWWWSFGNSDVYSMQGIFIPNMCLCRCQCNSIWNSVSFYLLPYLIIMKTQLVETFYLGRYRNSDSWMRVGLCLFGFLFLFCSLYQSESWLRNKGEVASHRRNKNVNLSSDAGRCVLKSQSHALFGLFSPWRNSLQWTGEIFKKPIEHFMFFCTTSVQEPVQLWVSIRSGDDRFFTDRNRRMFTHSNKIL